MEEIKTESAPGWARFLAQDGDGVWYWHASKPKPNGVTVCGEGYWISTGESCIVCRGELLGDWRSTLEKRPEEFNPFVSIEDNQERQMKQDNGWFERGELPPVGSECIFEPGSGSCYFNEYELKASGNIVKIIAHTRYEHSSSDVAVFIWDIDDCFGVSTGNAQAFRPIRTERDELIEIISSSLLVTTEQVADAIIAAGFKLEAK